MPVLACVLGGLVTTSLLAGELRRRVTRRVKTVYSAAYGSWVSRAPLSVQPTLAFTQGPAFVKQTEGVVRAGEGVYAIAGKRRVGRKRLAMCLAAQMKKDVYMVDAASMTKEGIQEVPDGACLVVHDVIEEDSRGFRHLTRPGLLVFVLVRRVTDLPSDLRAAISDVLNMRLCKAEDVVWVLRGLWGRGGEACIDVFTRECGEHKFGLPTLLLYISSRTAEECVRDVRAFKDLCRFQEAATPANGMYV